MHAQLITHSSLLAVALLGACGAPGLDELPAELYTSHPTYSKDVRPILVAYCTECHAEVGIAAEGIILDRYEAGLDDRHVAIRSVCSAISAEVKAKFSTTPEQAAAVFTSTTASIRGGRGERGGDRDCDDLLSMPPGAMTRLSAREQVILTRWLEVKAPK